jgi:hypothetical protein
MGANLDGLTIVSIDGEVKHPCRLVGTTREELRTICRPTKVQYGALMHVHGFSLALSLVSYLINANLEVECGRVRCDASAKGFTV